MGQYQMPLIEIHPQKLGSIVDLERKLTHSTCGSNQLFTKNK